MRKLLFLLIVVTIILSVTGEAIKTSNYENEIKTEAHYIDAVKEKTDDKRTITIGWEYYPSVNKDSDIPNTIIYLSVHEKEVKHYKLGTYTGGFYDVTKDDCGWELPDNSIINCFGWYGGAGDIFGVVKSGSNKLVVKHKFVEESGGDEDVANTILKTKFEDILTIDIDENAEIKTIKGINLNNNYEE